MIRIFMYSLLLIFLHVAAMAEESGKENPMILYPERYIEITEWSVYSARGVGIIHHVTIENTGDIAYRDVVVRVRYNSASYTNYGTEVTTQKGVLPVTISPRTKKTYLEGGAVLGANSSGFIPARIEVLGAVPLPAGN